MQPVEVYYHVKNNIHVFYKMCMECNSEGLQLFLMDFSYSDYVLAFRVLNYVYPNVRIQWKADSEFLHFMRVTILDNYYSDGIMITVVISLLKELFENYSLEFEDLTRLKNEIKQKDR